MVVVQSHATVGRDEQELVVTEVEHFLLSWDLEALLENIVRNVLVPNLHQETLCCVVTESKLSSNEPLLAH